MHIPGVIIAILIGGVLFDLDAWGIGAPMAHDKRKVVIGYVRVSTSQQGRSGLDIEAQKEALERFAASEGFTLGRVFVEIETGKGSDALSGALSLLLRSTRPAVSVVLWQWLSSIA
jgi:Resolvase, N terminal domain